MGDNPCGVRGKLTGKIGVAGREAERAEVWSGIDRISSRGLTILPIIQFFHVTSSRFSTFACFSFSFPMTFEFGSWMTLDFGSRIGFVSSFVSHLVNTK